VRLLTLLGAFALGACATANSTFEIVDAADAQSGENEPLPQLRVEAFNGGSTLPEDALIAVSTFCGSDHVLSPKEVELDSSGFWWQHSHNNRGDIVYQQAIYTFRCPVEGKDTI